MGFVSRLSVVTLVLIASALASCTVGVVGVVPGGHASTSVPIKSVDEMKATRDWAWYANTQLTPAEITAAVNADAALNATYITVDTDYSAPNAVKYAFEWATAIHGAGLHMWFRGIPREAVGTFISQHYHLFQAGDIFDANPEPNENVTNWTWANTPKAIAARNDYNNNKLIGQMNDANNALAAVGVTGVITGIRSQIDGIALSGALYTSTMQAMGYVPIDTYPEGNSTNPTACANALDSKVNALLAKAPAGVLPLISEHGYSNARAVSDTVQKDVL